MARWLPVVALLLVAAVAVPAGWADDDRDPLAPGNRLPGSFHPFNVNVPLPTSEEEEGAKTLPRRKSILPAYTSKGKFHCLVSEFDLDPVVMLVVRGNERNDAVRKLLQQLDGVIDRNRKMVRLRAFAVFLYDDLTDAVEQDEKREELARGLSDLVAELKLRYVVLTLGTKADLARYRIDDTSALTAILYQKLRIVATHKVPAAKLDAADGPAVKAILADVADGKKLGAKR